MKSKKKLLYLILSAIFVFSSLLVFAGANLRPIRASINHSFSYTLNQMPILSGTPAIIYQGVVYGPIDKLSEALGYRAVVKNNQAAISKPVPPSDTVFIPNARILRVDAANKLVTILPQGKQNNPTNQIVLVVSDRTIILDGTTNRRYSITDLTPNMFISAVHSLRMTNSIPPQTQAIRITVLRKATPTPPFPR